MVVVVVFSSRVLSESDRRDDLIFDLLGGFFLAVGIAAVLIPLNRAGALGWDHPVVWGGLALVSVVFVLFVWWECRTPPR